MGLPAEKITYHTLSNAMKGCLANELNKLQTIEVLDTFLNNGFDVNFVNSKNHGLLYYFLLTHQVELFRHCLTRGANIFIVDSKGQDVLDFTISLHNTVNFYNRTEFIKIVALELLGTDHYTMMIDKIEKYSLTVKEYYRNEIKQLLAKLNEEEIIYRKKDYELKFREKNEKPAKRVKI